MKVLDVPQLVRHGQAAIPIHAFSVSNPHLNPCENSHKSPMQNPPPKKKLKKNYNSSLIIKANIIKANMSRKYYFKANH